MANSIALCTAYLKAPEELLKTFNLKSRTKDLEVPCKFIGAQTVKYQHIEFGNSGIGTYNRDTGYTNNPINLTWKELTLTQDKGDSLKLDRMDDEEAQLEGVVSIVNRYIQQIQAPDIDKYRLSKIASLTHSNVVNSTLTSSNIVAKILEGFTALGEHRIDTENDLLLYMTSTAKNLLVEAEAAKIYIGNVWNGEVIPGVKVFNGAKIVEVPSSYFGNANVQAALVNKNAAMAVVKYSEVEFFNKIPGFGGRKAQADVGTYHDAFVYDELQRAVCLFIKTTSSTKTITYANGDASATGSVPTQSATVPGGTFVLATNPFTLANKTFKGWSDGKLLYNAGDTYYVPNSNVTLTAVWG